jgi:hypothetical protein
MARRRNALAPITIELQKDVAYALGCIRFQASPLVHVLCLQKLTPTKFGLEYAFLRAFLCTFFMKKFCLARKAPAFDSGGYEAVSSGSSSQGRIWLFIPP